MNRLISGMFDGLILLLGGWIYSSNGYTGLMSTLILWFVIDVILLIFVGDTKNV